MYLSRFRLYNYKSFFDSGEITFKPGINFIVGPNNSGKTALLQGLNLDFGNIAHKSPKTMPDDESQLQDGVSKAVYWVCLARQELKKMLIRSGNHIRIPYLKGPEGEAIPGPRQELNRRQTKNFEEWLDEVEDIEIRLTVGEEDSPPHQIFDKYRQTVTSLGKILVDSPISFVEVQPGGRVKGQVFSDTNSLESLKREEFLFYGFLAQRFKTQIFQFEAERRNHGVTKVGHRQVLDSQTEYLAQVLENLQEDRESFNKFEQNVQKVFPDISKITVGKVSDDEVLVRVWPFTNRKDLSVPLTLCGTGIGHVLSILYVAIQEKPQTILIDEPQSFLHPGALRKLFEILSSPECNHHQYIVSTHSPILVSEVNTSSVTVVSKVNGVSSAKTVDPKDKKELQSILEAIGAKLSDVFGFDRVLWVEGPTEEKCYPLILKKKRQVMQPSIQVLPVFSTSDFEVSRSSSSNNSIAQNKKDKEFKRVIDIYRKLTGCGSLLPPSIGFIFDLETKTVPEIERISQLSEYKVNFLECRMYENYLLLPEAIASVINNFDIGKEQEVTPDEVVRWIREKYDSSFISGEDALLTKEWQKNVDGAKLLAQVFSDLTSSRVSFSKTTHSVELTKYLLNHNSTKEFYENGDAYTLDDIAAQLEKILNQPQNDSSGS